MEIFKEFTIEAAHRLPALPPDHKCGRLHGHSFRIEVHVRGPVQQPRGWVIDFAEIKDAFQPIHEQLDHRFLNEVDGLANPTSENLSKWIWERLRPRLPLLSRVTVRETCTTGCVYEGEELA
jgi:6-pyruvoyltetrahydropterin/6-carboxytetrahydropterin synthase